MTTAQKLAANDNLAKVRTAIRTAGAPVTKAQTRDILGWRHMPEWEFSELESRGWIRRVANIPGVHCVDARYELTKPGTGR